MRATAKQIPSVLRDPPNGVSHGNILITNKKERTNGVSFGSLFLALRMGDGGLYKNYIKNTTKHYPRGHPECAFRNGSKPFGYAIEGKPTKPVGRPDKGGADLAAHYVRTNPRSFFAFVYTEQFFCPRKAIGNRSEISSARRLRLASTFCCSASLDCKKLRGLRGLLAILLSDDR